MRRSLLAPLVIVVTACGTGGGTDSPPVERALEFPTGEARTAVVERVLDGDSFVATIDGAETEVRLEGVNAPERDECLGSQARDRLGALLSAGSVTIDGDRTDQFDRLLGTVLAGDVLVNVRLVADGLALPLAVDSPLADAIIDAEAEARDARVGVWAPEACGSGPLPRVRITGLDANPPGPDDERLDEERITIENVGEVPIDLGGWVVRDESTANRFTFPEETLIAPGGRITVSSGCTPPGDDLAWCAERPVWNNGGDTALLLEPDGRIVDVFRYRDTD